MPITTPQTTFAHPRMLSGQVLMAGASTQDIQLPEGVVIASTSSILVSGNAPPTNGLTPNNTVNYTAAQLSANTFRITSRRTDGIAALDAAGNVAWAVAVHGPAKPPKGAKYRYSRIISGQATLAGGNCTVSVYGIGGITNAVIPPIIVTGTAGGVNLTVNYIAMPTGGAATTTDFLVRACIEAGTVNAADTTDVSWMLFID